MTEIKLTMIRHGQTEDNLKGVYSDSDIGLSELGKDQVLKMKEKLSLYSFDKVYFSPHIRTKESFELLTLDGQADFRIQETNFGIFTGRTYKDICELYPKESLRWFEDYLNYQIPEGESLKQMYERVIDFVKELERDTLIITHEGVIRSILAWVFDDLKYFYKFKIDNASISQIIIGDDYKIISKISEI